MECWKKFSGFKLSLPARHFGAAGDPLFVWRGAVPAPDEAVLQLPSLPASSASRNGAIDYQVIRSLTWVSPPCARRRQPPPARVDIRCTPYG